MIAAATALFVLDGLLFYLLASNQRLGRSVSPSAVTLSLFLMLGILTFTGFGLAHVGMNQSWTGQVMVTDFYWVAFGGVFVAGLSICYLLLHLQSSLSHIRLLSIASFLVLLGLIGIYVWEAKDANAYISTEALPQMRAYRDSIVDDSSMTQAQRTTLIRLIDPVPNELDYEGEPEHLLNEKFATVLNSDWLDHYNDSARRFNQAVESLAEDGHISPVLEIELYDAVRRQLAVAVLGLLLVPAIVFAAKLVRQNRVSHSKWLAVAVGATIFAVSVAALMGRSGGGLPASIDVAGQNLVIYEAVKVGLILLLALAIGDLAKKATGSGFVLPSVAILLGGAGLAVTGWLDPGSGVALLAFAGLMVALKTPRRWLYGLSVLGAVGLLGFVSTIRYDDSALPNNLSTRLEMWVDPWGTYDRAEVANLAARTLDHLVEARGVDTQSLRATAGNRAGVATTVLALGTDIDNLESELEWRLSVSVPPGLGPELEPFVPEVDTVDELVLLEAERLWADLGGYKVFSGAPSESRIESFEARVRTAIGEVRSQSDYYRSVVGDSKRSALAPTSDNFQLQRNLFALQAGGLTGRGLGLGRPEALPAVTEDGAIVAIGESLGFAGVVLVTLFVLSLTGGALTLSRAEKKPTRSLVLAGLGLAFSLQAFINMAGISGMLPFTGSPFPFISRSGSTLALNFVALGLILALASGERERPSVKRPLYVNGVKGRGEKLLALAGIPAAFAIVLASFGLVQLAGISLSPGAFLSKLPSSDSQQLHAPNQWDNADYRWVDGPIVDRNGRVLAETKAFGSARSYPDKDLAESLGHALTRLDLFARADADLFDPSGKSSPSRGQTLKTTIDSDVQMAVHAAIDIGVTDAGLPDTESLRSAVVVLDVVTGEIIALESRPAFALDELSDPLVWASAEARERRDGFTHRYLNRVIDGNYPPGSILKTITAAAVLETGLHDLSSRVFDYRSGSLGPRPPNGVSQLGTWHELEVAGGPPITGGNHPHLEEWVFSLEEAYAWSCNIAFSQMGLELGPDNLVDFARRFGFERSVQVPGLGQSFSSLDNDFLLETNSRYLAESQSNLARTAFGQGEAQVTPLQMALVAAGVANDGVIMQPTLVRRPATDEGREGNAMQFGVFADTRLSASTVADMQRMMTASATYGWANLATINEANAAPGVAGKTGSAEWSEELDASHAWFIGYFPVEAPRLALAVIVERGGAGPIVAVRIANEVFGSRAVEDYLNGVGQP